MAAKTLPRAQGYAHTNSKKGARLSVNDLATRTALYVWDDTKDCWALDQDGVQSVHCKGAGQQGFLWSTRLKQFTRCACEHCAR